MKKALLAAFIVLFATAAWAEDVKFSISGDFHARGSYWKNFSQGAPAADYESESYMDYDGDINLYPKLSVGNATLNFKIAIRDETWGSIANDVSKSVNTDWTSMAGQTYTTQKDDNINIERAWLTYKFGENTTLDVGLMDGQAWATTFGDYCMGRYRVKLTQKTPFGVIEGGLEKNVELGTSALKDSEKDDYDSYFLSAVTKAGDIYIKPLIFYVDNSAALSSSAPSIGETSDGVKVLYLALGFNGKLGALDFESELGYKKADWEDFEQLADYAAVNPALAAYANAKNSNVWGAYFNVWKSMDALTPGITLAYGSWDDEAGARGTGWGFDFRDDFCSNLILGDWIAWSDITGNEEDLVAATLIKPYVTDVKLADKLSASASFGYIMSNQKDNAYEDATAWEIDLGLAYKLSDNVTYSVDAGYADISYDVEGVEDPDEIMLLSHKIKFTF
ncbi:MAG TPA: hypothetical protein PLS81_04000 [Deltaproteobacteria bacterium]|nr:hypothetical protein [Deltaproteobacteria bacterium]